MAYINVLNKINISRGDCFQIPLFINMGTEENPVRLDIKEAQELNIEVYLGVFLPHQPFEYSLIRKKFTYQDVNRFGDVIIKIDSQDTIGLIPGNYKYSVKLRMCDPIQGEWVATIIDKEDFIVY